MPKHDNFLVDAVRPKPPKSGVGYVDGFRFGFGFFTAGLLLSVIVGGVAWGIIVALNLH